MEQPKLIMQRVMYHRTHGWSVWKNGELFYRAGAGVDLGDCKTVGYFDKLAKKGENWEARYQTAEKTDIYRRIGSEEWVFVESKISENEI